MRGHNITDQESLVDFILKEQNMKRFRDGIVNTYLYGAGWLRFKGYDVLPIKMEHDIKGLSHTDSEFDRFRNLDNWKKGLWWGDYHPKETKYSKQENVKLVEGGVEFITKPDPIEYDGRQYNYSTGVIQSTKVYGYGYFEVGCSVQPGFSLWHAPLWFVSKNSDSDFPVLPELDVSEVYSEEDGSRLRSNSDCHYGITYEEGKSLGARTHPLDFTKSLSFGVLWTPKKIEIYYNGFLVRQITRPDVIKRFHNAKLMPIIGSSVKNDKTANDEAKMRITYFRHSKLI